MKIKNVSEIRLQQECFFLGIKNIAHEKPMARGKSEEQKFDEFLVNESEPEESVAPNQGKYKKL